MSKHIEIMGLHSVLRKGKYQGRTILDVLEVEPGYVYGAWKNIPYFRIDNEVKALLRKRKPIDKPNLTPNFSEISESMLLANEDSIDWYGHAYFYLIEGPDWMKFGVTSNWEKRKFYYDKELKDVEWKVVKKEEYKHRWQAEFHEQIVVHQLTDWVFEGSNEWVMKKDKMKAKNLWKIINDTKGKIEAIGWGKYENLHRYGRSRFEHYKNKAMYDFGGISS